MKREMTSTRGEISVLGNTLSTMPKIGGIDFQFNIKRTVKGLAEVQNEANKVFKPIPKFIEYEKAVRALYEKECKRGEDMQPIIEEKEGQQVYTFDDDKAIGASIKLLEKKYAKGLKARRDQITAYNKLMGEEVTVTIYTIKDSLFPEVMPEGITEEQMNALVVLAEV